MATAVSPLPCILESTTPSTVSWDGDSMHPSPLASHPFRIPTPSFSDLDIPSELQFSSRPASASNITGTRTSYLGGDLHDTVRNGELIRRHRSRDDVAALIEFLRTHEPPPDNFMSQPYNNDDDERGRWGKFKTMGKRRSKSVGRIPAPIRLPDSAVSGVTTGGHRHIAISIPLDASHFSENPPSQYPVFSHEAEPPVPPLPESIRTYKNEKGVVTVLRPLSPEHYYSVPSSPASPRRFERDAPPQPLKNRRLVSSSPPPPSPADSECWPLAHTESGSSASIQGTQPSYETNERSRPVAGGLAQQSSEFVRAAYPSRGSSMAAKPRVQHHPNSSIDEVIAKEEPYNRNPSPMPREGVARRKSERRIGRPPVSLATSPMARKSTSNLRSEWHFDKEKPIKVSRISQASESPVIGGRDTSPSPPASIISVKSRREKVRDKKLRDLAAARNSKMGSKSIHTRGKSSDASIQNAKEPPAPKLSTIMVVVDMKPGGEDTPEEKKVAANDDTESVIEMPPESVLRLPGNPTPPTSTETSPSQQYGFDTRTSLTRRREWQVNREQDRKKREAAALAKAQLRQLAASGAYGGMDVADPEREIMRLYEAYREQRLREMENRVRRLEKNGDVWLQALIPMLENMDTNAVNASGQPRRPSLKDDDSVRDWASDDEANVGAENLKRASQRRKLVRRASLSRERMLEELMRREERDMLDNYDTGSGSTQDTSGMGSIEPLMRELAGGQATNANGMTAKTAPRMARQSSGSGTRGTPAIPMKARNSTNSVRVS